MFLFNVEKGLFKKISCAESSESFLALNWSITGDCQNHCLYCYGKDISTFDGLTGESLYYLLGNLVLINPNLIVITGGEPLLHNEIKKIVSVLANNYIPIILDTNGICDPSFLFDYKNRIHMRISLDSSDPKINECIRPSLIHDSTKIIKENIAKAARKMHITVQTTVTEYNLHSLMELGEYINCIGIKNWRLSLVIPHSNEFELKFIESYLNLKRMFPCISIRISNIGAEFEDHIVLVDPNGNLFVRNSSSNLKKKIGSISSGIIKRQDIQSHMDVKLHEERYILK